MLIDLDAKVDRGSAQEDTLAGEGDGGQAVNQCLFNATTKSTS